jgi:hypothetical protein
MAIACEESKTNKKIFNFIANDLIFQNFIFALSTIIHIIFYILALLLPPIFISFFNFILTLIQNNFDLHASCNKCLNKKSDKCTEKEFDISDTTLDEASCEKNEHIATSNNVSTSTEDEKPSQEQTVNNHRVHRAPMFFDPGLFHGTEDENIDQYFQRFEMVANANFWDDGCKIKYFPCYLRGTACQWYHVFSDTHSDKLDWPTLKNAALDAFKQLAFQDIVFDKLLSRYQDTDESATSYCYHILFLCQQYDPNMSEQMKMQFLRRGLNSSIIKNVLVHKADTVEQLIDNIKNAEYVRYLKQQRKNKIGNSSVMNNPIMQSTTPFMEVPRITTQERQNVPSPVPVISDMSTAYKSYNMASRPQENPDAGQQSSQQKTQYDQKTMQPFNDETDMHSQFQQHGSSNKYNIPFKKPKQQCNYCCRENHSSKTCFRKKDYFKKMSFMLTQTQSMMI